MPTAAQREPVCSYMRSEWALTRSEKLLDGSRNYFALTLGAACLSLSAPSCDLDAVVPGID